MNIFKRIINYLNSGNSKNYAQVFGIHYSLSRKPDGNTMISVHVDKYDGGYVIAKWRHDLKTHNEYAQVWDARKRMWVAYTHELSFGKIDSSYYVKDAVCVAEILRKQELII